VLAATFAAPASPLRDLSMRRTLLPQWRADQVPLRVVGPAWYGQRKCDVLPNRHGRSVHAVSTRVEQDIDLPSSSRTTTKLSSPIFRIRSRLGGISDSWARKTRNVRRHCAFSFVDVLLRTARPATRQREPTRVVQDLLGTIVRLTMFTIFSLAFRRR